MGEQSNAISATHDIEESEISSHEILILISFLTLSNEKDVRTYGDEI